MQPVVIHKNIISQLESIISAGRLNRTFLFIGGKDSGKTFLALQFIHLILGNSSKTNPNIHFFEGNSGEFKDKIDEFLSACEKAPFSGNHNVVFFDDFDKVPQTATNAMLKTIEEPPERTTIILTASSRHSLLDTIISRSFIFSLRSYNYTEKKEILWSSGIKNPSYRLAIVDDIKLCSSEDFKYLEDKAKKAKHVFKTLQRCDESKLLEVIEDLIKTITPQTYYQAIKNESESFEYQKHIAEMQKKIDSYCTPFLNLFAHANFLRNEYQRLKENT